jgi:putative DNA methylase
MDQRLIEVNFPLQQTSLDSVHEKNVRHGHISTLHIWPARRPLAASRAALITTLLRDPGTPSTRKEMLSKLAGRVVKRPPTGKQEQQAKEETAGGILHWGRETSEDLNWFRAQIREQYGGRAPRVLDPFAGGGAIPLEAMRLGCEVTAVDINPVAWFILKCTLEYPQRLAGQSRPLPEFVLHSREFMEGYLKAQGFKGRALKQQLALFGLNQEQREAVAQNELLSLAEQRAAIEADLAWHVRAWGWWVLQQAKAELARFYPTIDGKPTVAYLWARTVTCKNCRATIPLLKTRWLCKKEKKRIALTMQPNADKTGVVFGIWHDVPVGRGSATKRRAYDKQVGGGTMSGSGVTCPCCGITTKMEEIRQEAQSGRMGTMMTAVVVDTKDGKEYRLPAAEEICLASEAEKEVSRVFAEIPFGVPEEPLPAKEALGFRVPLYGFDKWYKLFTPRQLLALGIFVKCTRAVRGAMQENGYEQQWIEAVSAYLAIAFDRMIDRMSSSATWDNTRDGISHVFHRFALPIIWDFGEACPFSDAGGGFNQQLEWVMLYIKHALESIKDAPQSSVVNHSAIKNTSTAVDMIVTDPPYYDAIPYSDLMDFFYVWLRRTLHGLSPEIDAAFQQPLSPKWDHEQNDGELIDDSSRFEGDKQKSKANYEDGMARVFQNCYKMLADDGRFVVVFAHKHPDAWETLVSAIIRAGFVVTASWPIQTEMGNRTRALSSAALASSIWLVCRKRAEDARPGWDNKVLAEMRRNIVEKLHNFWDAGIRGPDFVWAATGPALEAYSQHPLVKKSNQLGQALSVKDFLTQARRIVVDFVIGQVLPESQGETSPLDTVTTYYLLHRYYFGTASVPVGPCILYAVSCGLSDSDLINRYDLLARSGGMAAKEENDENEEDEESDEEEEPNEPEEEEGTSSSVRLKQWYQRKSASLGYGTPGVPTPPLIDQIHRLMYFWQAGEEDKLSQYLVDQGLEQNAHFPRLLQALIELEGVSSEEKGILERISNYASNRKGVANYRLF